ncbi:MAG TPA: AAA family ATPase [Caldisericia bacterium]|nr:AAA family ATPase [Caldisericia bacterium]
MLTDKYRPKDFDQVIGHNEVVSVLKKQFENKTVPHAILLSGANGLGKTTIARIIGEKLNAETIEIDGATFGKIEVMRDLQESMLYKSFFKDSKVFIIDECHGLSKQSFDTFLKTIEEPPEHLYFIFCTTEPDKVVKGVKQRCHHFHLKPVPFDILKAFIVFVASEEGISLKEEIIDIIISNSNGSPRQALVLLEQVKDISSVEEATELMNTSFDKPEVYDLCRALVANKGFFECVKILEKIRDLNPISIKIQIVNYLTGCVFNARDERKMVYFLNMIRAFEETGNELSSILVALGKIYFEG